MTASALKGAIFASAMFEKAGFPVLPNSVEERVDIIQAVTFGNPEGVIAFCKGIQAAAPIDSFVSPEPCADRQQRRAVSVGYAGIYQQSHHGCRCLCIGFQH